MALLSASVTLGAMTLGADAARAVKGPGEELLAKRLEEEAKSRERIDALYRELRAEEAKALELRREKEGLIGKGRALDMILTGKMINADDALAFGLINYKTTHDQLMIFAKDLAKKILSNSSNAIKNAIKSVNANFRQDVNGFEFEINEFSKCFETKEFIEGTSAFLNKKKPDFN